MHITPEKSKVTIYFCFLSPYVVEVGFELTIQPRVASDLWSSCLSPQCPDYRQASPLASATYFKRTQKYLSPIRGDVMWSNDLFYTKLIWICTNTPKSAWHGVSPANCTINLASAEVHWHFATELHRLWSQAGVHPVQKGSRWLTLWCHHAPHRASRPSPRRWAAWWCRPVQSWVRYCWRQQCVGKWSWLFASSSCSVQWQPKPISVNSHLLKCLLKRNVAARAFQSVQQRSSKGTTPEKYPLPNPAPTHTMETLIVIEEGCGCREPIKRRMQLGTVAPTCNLRLRRRIPSFLSCLAT